VEVRFVSGDAFMRAGIAESMRHQALAFDFTLTQRAAMFQRSVGTGDRYSGLDQWKSAPLTGSPRP
jgi:hypothetical protein